jgi:hypothetical protein
MGNWEWAGGRITISILREIRGPQRGRGGGKQLVELVLISGLKSE